MQRTDLCSWVIPATNGVQQSSSTRELTSVSTDTAGSAPSATVTSTAGNDGVTNTVTGTNIAGNDGVTSTVTGTNIAGPGGSSARNGGRPLASVSPSSSSRSTAPVSQRTSHGSLPNGVTPTSTSEEVASAGLHSTSAGISSPRRGKRGSRSDSSATMKTATQNGAGNVTSDQLRSDDLHVDVEPIEASSTSSETRTTRHRLDTNRQTVTAGQQSTTSRTTTVSREHPPPRSTTRNTDNQDEVTYLQRLQETNRRLRQRQTCRLCRDRAVDTIFLPCGHLCTCESCAATIRACCLCHVVIRGTAHVYIE